MKRNHTLALVSVVAAGLSLVPLGNLLRTRASDVALSAQENGDVRGVLSSSVTARAAGRGNPWVNLRDGLSAPAQYQGASILVEQLKEDRAHPLSVGSADFDEDGVPDLVTGYAGTNGSVITVQRGDTETIFANTREAIEHRAQLRAAGRLSTTADDISSPFFVASRTFDVSSAPQFLGTGDFDGDGHRDVVTAESGSSALVLLSGDGTGEFAPARSIALPGRVTAFATGDVNRIDGLADIIVAVKGSGAPRLLIFEGAAGALNAPPEVITLPSESKSIALGQLDDSFPVDVAVAAGRELIIVRGRDRKHSTVEGKLDAEEPTVTRRAVSFSIASLTVGDFTGDLRHEIALLSDDGLCHVFLRPPSSGSNWREASSVALPVQKGDPAVSSRVLVPVRVSSSPNDDLLVLDQAAHQLQILINETATFSDERAEKGPASSRLLVASTIDFDGEPVAVLGMRLNSDALNDLVVLRSNASAPTVLLTSPTAVFSVTNTNDSGAGSLRQAITSANSNPGVDSITFNIAGSGTQTITLLSQLPGISGAVTIDGATQNPGSATPPIELNGSSAGLEVTGLSVAGGNSTVRGMTINRFGGIGMALFGSGSIVEGNFIGTNATGTAAQGNGETGVLINAGSGHVIGGTAAASRNVISGNVNHGVQVLLGPAMNHQVQGNFIGTNAAGTSGLGNQSNGVDMLSSPPPNGIINCTIGGTTAGARNVISANSGVGVQFLTVGTVNLVQGNFIGTDASGSTDLGNASSGVAITEATDCTVGGTVAGAGNLISGNGSNGVRINSATSTGNRVQGNRIGTRADGATSLPNSSDGVRILNSASNNTIGGLAGEGNIIAFNLGNGVMVDSGTGNAIRSNAIFSNSGLGIDLGAAGVTPNDVGDGDAGANNLQNFPVLTFSNGVAGGGVNVQGTLNSTANTTFALDFFSNQSCDSSGNGEGQTFLGSASVTTSAVGNATFNVNLVASASVGQSITATATNPAGSTSEFSACVPYGAADLGVTKTASSGTIVVGSNVTYTITLVNNGPDPASSVTVTDNLPASLAFSSCNSTGGGMCSGIGNNRVVSFSSLASGASATITIVATLSCTVSDGLSIGNTASVASPLRDPVSGNNSSTVNFTASNPPRVILPTNQSFPADGGDSTVSVTAPAGCGWQTVSNDSWLTITSGSIGTGNGSVGYHVAVNGTGSPRTGTLTIAGLTFTVNQTNVFCSYSILPTSTSVAAGGGSGSINVTTQAGCLWMAKSNDAWISLVPGTDEGSGNGSTSYTVEANASTTSRTGTISVAGQTFTVMQAGAPCSFSLEPTGKLFGAAGTEGSFTITTTAGCNWTASTTDNWIFITSEASGSGPAMVNYGVRDNSTGSPRQGTITVSGVTFTIVQDGGINECVYVLNPSSAVFTSAGGSGNVQLVTGAGCAWGATTGVNWITLTSQVVGIGPNTVTYNVQPNPGSSGRAGVIVIGGQSFRVKQQGN